MSDASPLPDDLSRWPADPYELLGVKPGVDEKELKRAYQRLLRLYRPDHKPDEFRRIREAYEAIRDHGQWFAFLANQGAATGQELPDRERSDSESRAEHEPLPRTTVDQLLATAAGLARDGHTTEAYAQFSKLAVDYPARAEPYLACYWLLRFEPALDRMQKPIGRLQAALMRGTSGPALVAAFVRELRRVPSEAVAPNLVETALALKQADDVINVLEARWRAAAWLETWAVVETDLARIQQSPWWLDRHAWLTLMAVALDAVCWTLDPRAVSVADLCRRLLDEYQNAHVSQFDALARLDYLREVSLGVRAVGPTISPALLRLLSFPLLADPREGYLDLIAWLHACEMEPTQVLRELSSFGEWAPRLWQRLQEVLHAVAGALGRLDDGELNVQQWRLSVENATEAIFSLTHEDDVREALLGYCLERSLAPHSFAAVLIEAHVSDVEYRRRTVEWIMSDGAVHCAYAALRLLDA
jgi:hypothetical protein